MEQTTQAPRWERWVTAPRQQRARDTFERVLDEGAALLAEEGYEGFSMNEVCRRAQVATGTLYDRVDGKDSLFLALHDRELERINAVCLAVLAGIDASELDAGELVDEVVTALCHHYRDERRLLRTFILRAAVDPRVRDAAVHHVVRLEQEIVATLLSGPHRYPHPDPEQAARAAVAIALESLSFQTAFGTDFYRDLDADDDRAQRLRDVCRTYLVTPPAAG